MAYALFTPNDTSTPEGRARERYRRLALSITSGVVGRGLAAAVSLLTAPLLLSYLGKERFGLYSAIMGTVVWLGLLDLGVSGGLVNSTSEAYGRGDRQAVRAYAATALAALSAGGFIAGIVFAVVSDFVSWDALFGAMGLSSRVEVHQAVTAAVVAALVGVPLAVIPSVYAGLQRVYVANVFTMISSVSTLIAVWLAVELRIALSGLIGLVAGSAVAAGIANLIVLLRDELPSLRAFAAHVSWRAWQRISRTSLPLFVFQIGTLMVNQSQLFILTHTSTLAVTADYAVLMRIVQIFSGVVILATAAFFPAYREAAERGDHAWVREGFRRMLAARMGLVLAFAIVLMLKGNDLLALWLQRDDVRFSAQLWTLFGIYLTAGIWVSAHSELMTVLDRIWAQVGLVVANGMITILLTLWLSPRYGAVGVVAAASFVTVLGWTWIFPRLTRGILSSRSL